MIKTKLWKMFPTTAPRPFHPCRTIVAMEVRAIALVRTVIDATESCLYEQRPVTLLW